MKRGENSLIDWRRGWTTILVLLSIVVFLSLRLRNLGHLLTWDESQFVLINRAYVGGIDNQFHLLVNHHPPIYLWVSSFLYKYLHLEAKSYQLVSVILSLGTLLLVYALARFLYGERVGALSCFIYATLPAATVLDTWIKQDALAIFFLALTIYLFVKGRYGWGGVAIGLGMLCKEIAVFALMVLVIYALVCRSKDKIKGTLIVGAVGFLISFWWYLFFSTSKGTFWGFFWGSSLEAKVWKLPWHFYLRGLPTDLGWLILVLCFYGLALCIYRGIEGSRAFFLPAVWMLSIYIFLSFSYGKPYWMVGSALPAAAILAALGIDQLTWHIRRSELGKRTLIPLASLVVAGALIFFLMVGIFTEYKNYNMKRMPNYWLGAEYARDDALYFRKNMIEGESIFAIFNSVNRDDPTFLYYLGRVDYVSQPWDFLEKPDKVAAYVRGSGIDWIYIGRDAAYMETLERFMSRIGDYLRGTVRETVWSIIIHVEG